MADFVLKKRKGFTFRIEGDAREYTIPALSNLTFADGAMLSKAETESDIVKRGKIVKEFILKFAPGLDGIDDMEFFDIFNAYANTIGRAKMGESQASQDS